MAWKALKNTMTVPAFVESLVARSESSGLDGHLATPFAEVTDPLIPKPQTDVASDMSNRERDHQISDCLFDPPGCKRLSNLSSSERMLGTGGRSSGQTELELGDLMDSRMKIALQLERNKPSHPSLYHLMRAPSHPPNPTKLRTRHYDSDADCATLRQEPERHDKPTCDPSSVSWPERNAPTATDSSNWLDPSLPKPNFKRFDAWSASEPTPSLQASYSPNKHEKELSLRSSMEGKSKSAATTPPSGMTTGADTRTGSPSLRRAKTVDFQESMAKESIARKPLPLLPLQMSSSDHDQANDRRGQQLNVQVENSTYKRLEVLDKTKLYSVLATKSRVAAPAVTRADVHVVAIASRRGSEEVADEGDIDPATPTMQIVQSNNGSFKVIWDDIPAEHDGRLRRESSCASQAVDMIRSTAACGLERVNSKLTEWTWGHESLTELPKPQVAVYPDEDGHPLPMMHAEDDEEISIFAPPNSISPSIISSRYASQPVSSRLSRSVSHEEPNPESAYEADHIYPSPQEPNQQVVVPDPEASPGSLTVAARRMKQSSGARRLSNMEESEMKFRGHRDSVMLAHTRIPHSGTISSESSPHRDSLSSEKKHMHAINDHAVTHVRDVPRSRVVASEPPSPGLDTLGSSRLPSPHTAKEQMG